MFYTIGYSLDVLMNISKEVSSNAKDLMQFTSSMACRSVADDVQVITPADWIIFQPSRKRESIINVIDDGSNWYSCKYDGIR